MCFSSVLQHFMLMIIWVMSWENPFSPYANNKGTDQLAHPFSPISTFVVCWLDSIISLVFYHWEIMEWTFSFLEIMDLWHAHATEISCKLLEAWLMIKPTVMNVFFFFFFFLLLTEMSMSFRYTNSLDSNRTILDKNEPPHDKTNKMASAQSDQSSLCT